MNPILRLTVFAALLLSSMSWTTRAQETAADEESTDTISIAELQRDTPVDFEKEILPILRKNCVACHSASDAESDLVLESPQSILKGGDSGPAAAAGEGADSLLLGRATGRVESTLDAITLSVENAEVLA